jgi:hypothetical protein
MRWALFVVLPVLPVLPLLPGCIASTPGDVQVLRTDKDAMWIVRDGLAVVKDTHRKVRVIYYCLPPAPPNPHPRCSSAEFVNNTYRDVFWPHNLVR